LTPTHELPAFRHARRGDIEFPLRNLDRLQYRYYILSSMESGLYIYTHITQHSLPRVQVKIKKNRFKTPFPTTKKKYMFQTKISQKAVFKSYHTFRYTDPLHI